MKTRLTLALVAAAALLTAGLATGGAVFLLGAALLTLLTLSSLAAVTWAARTMETQVELSARTVRRGDSVTLTVRARHQGLLPIAPVTLTLSATPDVPETQVTLRDAPGKSQCLTMPFHASHVGVCAPGVTRCQVEDVLGLFSRVIIPARNGGELTVLPMTFPVEPLTFAPGESGSEEVARATEDVTNPSDVRSYQPGDAMKKIHWKLSLRKRELMVRRFEEPILPDGLILLDCSPPPSWGHPEAEADVRDALLETAASVMAQELGASHAIRLPLRGAHPVELEKHLGMPLVLENLARVDFSETDRFERVLLLETRRMRRTGATVVISARLSGSMVDVMTRMRRMGPTLRLYLVTFTPDAPQLAPMIGRLQQAEIEVCYVTPVPA